MMKANEICMPIAYAEINENEMIYLTGGDAPYTQYQGYVSTSVCAGIAAGIKSIADAVRDLCSRNDVTSMALLTRCLGGLVSSVWEKAGKNSGLNIYGMWNSSTWAFMGYYTSYR